MYWYIYIYIGHHGGHFPRRLRGRCSQVYCGMRRQSAGRKKGFLDICLLFVKEEVSILLHVRKLRWLGQVGLFFFCFFFFCRYMIWICYESARNRFQG